MATRVHNHAICLAGLGLLTFAALVIHGYHLGVDDAAIYVPAIKRVSDPLLYPFGSEFFMQHAHLSLFSDIVGGASRFGHIPVDTAIFLAHLIGVFLLLAAGWRLLGACYENPAARWCGVALLAALMTVPVAGTALVMMDPYVTARSLSTPASLFAVASWIAGKRWQAAAWLVLTAAVHPQMAAYAVVFVLCMAASKPARLAVLPALPGVFSLEPTRGPAREAFLSRTFFWLSNWAWYEWIGIIAPVAICWQLSRLSVRGTKPAFPALLQAIIPFSFLFLAAGLLVTFDSHLENLVRLQPMRAFHLVYLIFFPLLGGLLGEYVLSTRAWRWGALFLPMAVGMWLVQNDAYPSSVAIEWPGTRDTNHWSAAFYWIRENTPKTAVFALDPGHMKLPGEDMHGFRALAERSMLADAVKDSGAVSMFPLLGDDWKRQVDAQMGVEQFKEVEFQQLQRAYPVTWIVTRQAPPMGLWCPYQKGGLSVCRLPVNTPDSAVVTRSTGPPVAGRRPE